MIVKFEYSRKKDVENYVKYVLNPPEWLDQKIVKNISSRIKQEDLERLSASKDKPEVYELLEKIVKQAWNNEKDFFEKKISDLTNTWNERENGFIKKLEQFHEKPFLFNTITVHFTTLPINPYNIKERWFMVSIRNPIERQIKTVGHELMHFIFISQYWNYCIEDLGLSEKQVDMIKEALTVFLNTEFSKWIKVEDKGHERESELRDYLLTTKPNASSFPDLLKLVAKNLQKSA